MHLNGKCLITGKAKDIILTSYVKLNETMAIKKVSKVKVDLQGAQWPSGRVLDSRLRGCGFEPHRHHCVVSLSKNIDPSLVLVQPRKTGPFITERLLMGCKESNQTNKSRLSFDQCI